MDRFLKGTSSSADARAGASSSAGSSTSPAAAPMPSRAPTFEQAKADGTLQTSSLPACAAFVLLARFTSPVGAPEAISTTDWLHDSRILMKDAWSTWGGGGGR